jgi:hypothetical protein
MSSVPFWPVRLMDLNAPTAQCAAFYRTRRDRNSEAVICTGLAIVHHGDLQCAWCPVICAGPFERGCIARDGEGGEALAFDLRAIRVTCPRLVPQDRRPRGGFVTPDSDGPLGAQNALVEWGALRGIWLPVNGSALYTSKL